jgi:hypothetical protein
VRSETSEVSRALSARARQPADMLRSYVHEALMPSHVPVDNNINVPFKDIRPPRLAGPAAAGSAKRPYNSASRDGVVRAPLRASQ